MKENIKRLIFNHLLKDRVDNDYVRYLGSEYGGFYLDLRVNENPVVFDVGIGEDMSFSDSLLKMRPKSKIFAVDPTSRSIHWFKKSKFYKINNIHFIEKALYIQSGDSNFYAPKNKNHVSHSLVVNKNISLDDQVLVETVSLEDLCKSLKLKRIDVLKIDVEGSEYQILENLSKRSLLPLQICVEYHDRFYNILFPRSRKTHRHLKSIGYELIGVSRSMQEITYKLK